jgi:diguanylate cyclase (GGDEF)-like protein/PAS domain S-box-containing protein
VPAKAPVSDVRDLSTAEACPPIDGLALRDAIFAHLPRQCVLSVDTRLRYQLAAGPLLALLGMDGADVVGRTVVDVLREDDGSEMLARYQTALAGTEVTFDRQFRDFYLEQTISPMYLPGSDRVVGAIAVIRDVSHRRRNELHLEALAETDPLTLLDNRRAYERKRNGQLRLPTSLLVLDLNGFKTLNDTRGHAAGDDALREVAELLREHTRPTDVLARVGGDEFGVILPHADGDAADKVADRIREAIAQVPGLSAAVGVSTWPDDGTDIHEVQRVADSRMYEDKRGQSGSRRRTADPSVA